MEAEKMVILKNENFVQEASIILEGLGGKENVASFDNCMTRLHFMLKDDTKVDDKKVKTAGIAGIIRPGKNSIQVVIGTKVQLIADELKKMLS